MNSRIINKAWDDTWEKVFRTQEWGKYPPEDFIRFTARNFYNSNQRKEVRFLEIGCGTGANCWYLAREGFTVYGVDGSNTAIKKAKLRFKNENLKGFFNVMDYAKINFPDDFFDAVIDVCSLQHNHVNQIPSILKEVKRVLKSKGKFFSMIVSEGTYKVPYEDKGYTHFWKLNELRKILKNSCIERTERTENNRKNKIIHWVVTTEKEDM